MTTMRRLAACMVPLLAAGCYTYVPVRLDELRPDDSIRARISDEHAGELDEIVMRDARVLEGTVVQTTPDLLLQVPVVSTFQGMARQTLSQRVRVPREELAAVELRSLDRTRTGLLVGGGIAVALGAVIYGLTGEGGGDTRPNPPPPPELRAPLGIHWLRIAW